jgi:hypothetical protein
VSRCIATSLPTLESLENFYCRKHLGATGNERNSIAEAVYRIPSFRAVLSGKPVLSLNEQ